MVNAIWRAWSASRSRPSLATGPPAWPAPSRWKPAPARRWRRPRRGPPPRPAAGDGGPSPEVLFLEERQVLGEVLQRHVGIDLAAVDGERRHEGGVALAPHGEGGHVAGGLDLPQHVVVPAAVGIGDGVGRLAELPLEELPGLRELGMHALVELGGALTRGATKVAVGLGVRLDIEALGLERLDVRPRERVA